MTSRLRFSGRVYKDRIPYFFSSCMMSFFSKSNFSAIILSYIPSKLVLGCCIMVCNSEFLKNTTNKRWFLAMARRYFNCLCRPSNVSKLVKSSAAVDPDSFSLFNILKEEDIQNRFSKELEMQRVMDFSPTAGYDVPSTKFNVLFNPESDYFKYLIKAKNRIELLKKSTSCMEDKLHYDLLLKQINASLKVE